MLPLNIHNNSLLVILSINIWPKMGKKKGCKVQTTVSILALSTAASHLCSERCREGFV